jgi:glycyl-tRNA synthetase alpha subunit
MEGNNQLNFTGQIHDAITLMNHESSFDINAYIFEYLNENSNVTNVEDKAMYFKYEEYIHLTIEQEVKCSNYNFYLISDEDDHSYFLRYNIQAPDCAATSELKVSSWCYTEKYKSKGFHIVNGLHPKKFIKHITRHYFIDETIFKADGDFYAAYCHECHCMNKISVPHLPERCFFCLQELCKRELILHPTKWISIEKSKLSQP